MYHECHDCAAGTWTYQFRGMTECMAIPTSAPTKAPTKTPTKAPTAPTKSPTKSPTGSPTDYPTDYPTEYPSAAPTAYPTAFPTNYPTGYPTAYPTSYPTFSPCNIWLGPGQSMNCYGRGQGCNYDASGACTCALLPHMIGCEETTTSAPSSAFGGIGPGQAIN
jgi:hypothetical protein